MMRDLKSTVPTNLAPLLQKKLFGIALNFFRLWGLRYANGFMSVHCYDRFEILVQN